jgi:hypothetical protein
MPYSKWFLILHITTVVNPINFRWDSILILGPNYTLLQGIKCVCWDIVKRNAVYNSFATTGYNFYTIPLTEFGNIHQWGLFSCYIGLGQRNTKFHKKIARWQHNLFFNLNLRPRSTATYWFYTLIVDLALWLAVTLALGTSGVSEPSQYRVWSRKPA